VSAGKTIRSKTGVRKLQKSFAADLSDRIQIAFLLQDWSDGYNVGGMFRVADALGAEELVMTGGTPTPPHPMIGVTSLGAHRRLKFRHIQDHERAALTLKAEGYSLVAVELAEGAVNYLDYAWPSKVCLVLGNEQKGVYGKVMKHVDAAVFIPMFGKGRSINVHVAAAVVGFDAVLRPRAVIEPEQTP
jgi:23S rRNA (guanosine2251-2'-O)-methyltransferase